MKKCMFDMAREKQESTYVWCDKQGRNRIVCLMWKIMVKKEMYVWCYKGGRNGRIVCFMWQRKKNKCIFGLTNEKEDERYIWRDKKK